MKTHKTDMVSLVFGVIFLVIVAGWFGGSVLDLSVINVGWLLAFALIGLGLAGVLMNLRPQPQPVTEQVKPANPDDPTA